MNIYDPAGFNALRQLLYALQYQTNTYNRGYFTTTDAEYEIWFDHDINKFEYAVAYKDGNLEQHVLEDGMTMEDFLEASQTDYFVSVDVENNGSLVNVYKSRPQSEDEPSGKRSRLRFGKNTLLKQINKEIKCLVNLK